MTGAPSDPGGPAARTTDHDDVAMLERLRANDRDAMASLYDAYGGMAYGLAYRVAGDAKEAEDVVQEAFLTLWRQADRLDAARGSVGSLLMTIVHRRAVDLVRRRAGRREAHLDDALPLAAATSDPIEFASLAEERETVGRAMGELPAEQRRAVELTYFGGLTVAEMAEQEAIPVGTAKSRLRLALERMRKTIGEPRPV